jgi:hypothetical protein
MFGRETIKRLSEDAARAFRPGTKESADRHLETGLVPKDRFLGKATRVAAVDRPGFITADGAECVGVGRRDPESQDVALEIGLDQATADGGAQKLGEKQGMSPKR